MPNHITTIIRANQNVIEHLITKDDKNNKIFDFNTVIPTPDNVFQGDLGSAEEARYPGEDNWMGWNTRHWGTKWNAYDFKQISEEEIHFNTAWRHPFPVIQKISEIFPTETLIIAYADENIGYNLGVYSMKNGEIIQESAILQENDSIAKNFASILVYNQSYLYFLQEDLDNLQEMLPEVISESNQVEIDKFENEIEELDQLIGEFEDELAHAQVDFYDIKTFLE